MAVQSKANQNGGTQKISTEKVDEGVLKAICKKLKIDFSPYITFDYLIKLAKDLFELRKYLKLKDYKAVLNIAKGYSVILLPLLGCTLEFIVANLPLGELGPLIATKIQFILQSIGCGLWLGLAIYFAFQYKDLYCIGSAINEVERELKDASIQNEFKIIARNIDQLKRIEREMQQWKANYEACKDEVDLTKMTRDIEIKMTRAVNIYQRTLDLIKELRLKFDNNTQKLDNNQNKAKTALGISGTLSLVCVFPIALCPLFSFVAISASAVTYFWSGALLIQMDTLKRELIKLSNQLDKYKRQLDETMDQIKEHKEWSDGLWIAENDFLKEILA